MKKSLIALAVAGVFTAPAFAATSNVDVYGKLNVSVSFLNDQVATADNMQVSSNASRIGFKGSEDLGGGLKGVWQIEQTIAVDEGANTLATRNTFLGLAGGFGTALIGRHDTPTKLIGRQVDLFGDTIGDHRNILGGGADQRPNNVIVYISPNFSGFAVAAAYVNDDNATDLDIFDINATYTNGPIFAGVSYANGDGLGAATDNMWRLAGSYTFGDFKAVAQYEDHEDVYSGWMLGGAYKMGPITLKANYANREMDADDEDISQWNLGVDYALSKRTSVYAMYTDGSDDSAAAAYTLGSGAGTSDQVTHDGAGDVSAITLGVMHTF